MRVFDLWFVDDGKLICWRCECEFCYYWFMIFEKVEEILFIVVKKEGVCEEFSREKMLCGFIKVCEKRFVLFKMFEDMCFDIEKEFCN